MKIFKIFTVMCCLVFGFTACETYDDPEVEYSSIALMSGEWIVKLTDPSNVAAKAVMYTYNTADESTTQMWLRIGTATASNAKFGVRGKVGIDLANKSFSVVGEQNAYLTTNSKFTVTGGTVITDGATTPSGHKADAISFKLTSDKNPGVEYTVEGYRRTGWPEDE